MASFNVTIPQDGIYGIRIIDMETDTEVAQMSVDCVGGRQYRVETVGPSGYIKPKPVKQ